MTKPKGNIEAIYGLSPMQEGLLFHTVHSPESGLYFEQYSCLLGGSLDTAAFERAWQLVTDRHPALRSLFTWEGRPKPLQIVRHTVTLPWTHEDWRELSLPEQETRLDRYLETDRSRGFVLDQAPLIRLALFRTDDDATRFVWSFHHLLLDGWSMRRVLDEVLQSYESIRGGRRPSLPRPRPYRDYIAWLHQQKPGDAEAFWKHRLDGFTTPTPLPGLTTPRSSPWAERHLTEEIRLDPEATSSLRSLARRHRLTLNTLVRGAWALLLSRYSGENDIVFGATVSGRPAELDGVQEMVGLFINTLPVRIDASPDQPLFPWLEGIQREQIEATAFDSTPLVDVQRWSEVTGRPLFQTLLVFENLPGDPGAPEKGCSLRLSDARYIEQSNFPLAVLAVPGPELRFILVYDRDRFEGDSIRRLAGHLRTLLEGMIGVGDVPLGDLPILSDRERNQILLSWNDTKAPYPQDACIHHLIEQKVEEAPDEIAVIFEDASVSYRELDERAGDVARQLRAVGVGPGACVGIALERSVEMVVGILGILKAGGAYLPLDPEQPGERLRFMLEDAPARAVLTTEEFAHRLPTLGVSVIRLSASAPVAPAETIDDPTTPDDLAYVIYTSGSTGQPKGVEVTHGNLVHSTTARFRYYPEPVSRYCLVSPFVFDSSVAGLFWTLCQGGTLVLPSPRMEQDLPALEQLLKQEQVTHILTLPTLYGLFLQHSEVSNLQSLTTVILAGEACSSDTVRAHFRQLPSTTLHNEYGPTEATVWCTAHRFESTSVGPRVPIGRPIPNTQIYILDSRLAPVPIGVAGELFVGGHGLARGYVNHPELTAERFIQHAIPGVGETRLYRTGDRARFLPDGTIEFLGRVDHQVKIRGHRIELGEIEAALKEQPAVRDAVVVLEAPPPPDDIDALLHRVRILGEERATEILDEIDALSPDTIDGLLTPET